MAVTFGASGRYLRRTANLPSSTSVTIAAWVYWSTIRNTYSYVFELGDATTNAGAYLVLGHANATTLEISTGATNTTFSTNVSSGTWTFAAITCAGTEATDFKGYWRGVTDTAFVTASATGRGFTPAALYVGSDSWDEWTDSRIGPVYVFGRVLTEAELWQLSQSIRPNVTGAMPSLWSPLWSASDVADYSGNGYNWTVGGTLGTADGPPVSWGALGWQPPFVASGGGAQTINANAISSGASVYQPSVTPGAVTVSLNAISSAATVYQPTVAPGAVTVSLNAISSGATVYQPAVSQGGGTQTINANAISSGASVYQPVVTPGAVTVSPNAIASTATVYQPAVTSVATISPNAISSGAQVYQPSVAAGAVTVSPNAIASTATVYQPVITSGGFVVQPNAISSVATVYQPAVTPGAMTVSPNAISSGATVYQPAITTTGGSWWLAGGVSAANAIAVYQPIGAASLAASYSNLANPGTYNAAPGTAPTFDAATGWTFAAASSQYLTTGIVPATTWTMLIRISNAVADTWFVGMFETDKLRFALRTATSAGGSINYCNGAYATGEIYVTPGATAGVIAVAGANCYRNGVADGTITQGVTAAATRALVLGARNVNGTVGGYFTGKIQAVAIYNTTLTATQVAAISTAMAALSGAQTISPNAISSGAQVYQPAVTPGGVTVNPNVITSVAQVFTVAVSAIVAGRIYQVQTEDRTWAIPAEDRTYSIGD